MIDTLYRIKFMQIWNECMKNGFSTSDARDYASIELNNKPFHNNEQNTNDIRAIYGTKDNEGTDRYSIKVSS